MKLIDVKLESLRVNRENDRHGEVADEDAAIQWLLTHRANHMRNLTKDIVKSGEIFEPPLVAAHGQQYVVYDGNRRTAAIKLLSRPERAPSQDWSKFFREQRSQWQNKFPTTLQCQLEDDQERLDEILYRRHTGQQGGVGQSQWDAEAKSNFQRRTGKNSRINVAEEIETLLRQRGYLDDDQRIPRSNLNRLLSAEQFRNRAGIAVENNKLKVTHSEEKVLGALHRIASDLISKKITLDDIWDNEHKRTYLNDLDKAGVLPVADDALPEPKPPDHQPGPPKPKPPTPPPAPPDAKGRKALIRNIDHGIQPTTQNRRVLDIFAELQHRLNFSDHGNAIAVLLRVLLELGIDQYIEQEKLPNIHPNDKLAKKFRKCADHMLSEQRIDSKYHQILKKLEQSEPVISTNTLHGYVHSPNFFPSDTHLKSIWDTLERYVLICIKS